MRNVGFALTLCLSPLLASACSSTGGAASEPELGTPTAPVEAESAEIAAASIPAALDVSVVEAGAAQDPGGIDLQQEWQNLTLQARHRFAGSECARELA